MSQLRPHRPAVSKSGSSGAYRSHRERSGARLFQPGDPVRETGIYEVVHDGDHRGLHEAVMLAHDAFPGCETCGERVRFRLVRTAPYIFHDDDFET